MQLKLEILCIFNVLTVNGFEVFGINDGYRGFVEQINSMVILPREDVIERWIEQKLDHFNAYETRTWKMRYYEKLNFWTTDGPVYLFINGEAPATPNFLTTGILYELAKETKGAMYLSEHRYYGKSQPLNRSHFNVDDMKYLSSEQALADNAKLLRFVKDNILYKNSKIVVVGGSYAGNLAAWMKLVYPDLVDAVISSSGPVLAKTDFYEYLEVVAQDYKKYGTYDCLQKLTQKFQWYDILFETEAGILELKKEENICEKTDMTELENKQLFFLAKASYFMTKAQYGSVDVIFNCCLNLSHIQRTTILEDDTKYFWNDEENCYDYDFERTLLEYREAKNNDMYCWTYQTCTQFGYFQTTTSDNQPFTKNIPVEWYVKFCTGLFGVGFDEDRVNEGVKKINEMYGGKSLNVTEVVFVNGGLDPWSSLGITTGGSDDAPVVYIHRSSHCRDLFSNKVDDDEELKEARVRIKDQIKKWIRASDNVWPVS